MVKISSDNKKILWNITKEVCDAIDYCKKHPEKMITLQVPDTSTRLAGELLLNEFKTQTTAISNWNYQKTQIQNWIKPLYTEF